MPDVDEKAVQARAKLLAERDGYVWELTEELNFQSMSPGAKIKLQPHLSDKRRQEYLTRARAELRAEPKEADDAA